MSAQYTAQLHPLTNEARLRREIVCDHLWDVVEADCGKHVRFHFVGESHILAQAGDLGSQPEDADGLPDFGPCAGAGKLQFFFTAVLDLDDGDENDEDDE